MENEIVEAWLNGISETSRPIYKRNWQLLTEYTDKTPTQLLELENGDKKALLFGFVAWLKKPIHTIGKQKIPNQRYSDNAVKTASGVLRGFYSFHDKTIKLTKGEKDRLRKVKRVSQDYRFTKEDIKKIAMVSDLKEQYVILAGKSFGLRAGDFINLTYGDFRAIDLDSETPIYLGEIATEKEGLNANPFIDSDTQPIIKAMLEGNKKRKDTDRILKVNSQELSVILQRISERANIQHGNRRIRFHCLRKFLSDRLSSYMSESQWKQVVGKKIKEGAYVSTDMLRNNFNRAMKDLTCMNQNSQNHETITRQQIEIEDLKTRISALTQQLTKSTKSMNAMAKDVNALMFDMAKRTNNKKQKDKTFIFDKRK